MPELAQAAVDRARAAGFAYSSDPEVGLLLVTLSAGVPIGGRILEIGTGTGVGLAWLVDGLRGRTDVAVTSVEIDPVVAAVAADLDWPPYVELITGDVLPLLTEQPETFDLIFADAPGGKWTNLDATIHALQPPGRLLVDDMTPPRWLDEQHRDATASVRTELERHEQLVSVEMRVGTGVILSTKRVVAS